MSRTAAVSEPIGGSSPLELELPIGGMTCTNCAHRIEQELASQHGVAEASVSFATRRARIVGHEEAPGELAGRAAAAVSSLGYSVQQRPMSPTASAASGAAAQRVDEAAPAVADATTSGGVIGLAWHDWPLTAVLAAGCWLVSMVSALQFTGWRFAVGAAATIALVWGGRRVLANAWGAARHRSTTMDTLISLGVLTAWAWSAAQVASGGSESAHLYFDAVAVIIAFVTLGRWLEDRAMTRTGDAVRALAELTVPTVRLADGAEINAADLDVGMQFVVRPGERIAADGVVTEGTSTVDVSMMTGEPVPVDVAPSQEVVGGTLNGNGALVVRATAVGADTALARITELTRRAQDSRADVGRLADRVSAVFVPLAVGIALVTFAAWLAVGGVWGDDGATQAAFGEAVTAAVAVLVISCPCALGLATPVALAVGVGRAAQLGVLVRGAQVFEDSRHVDAVVFDKTGTVTRGAMSVTEVAAPGPQGSGGSTTELLSLSACAESASEHPIGRAIAAAAPASAPERAPELLEAQAVPGVGVTASIRVPSGTANGAAAGGGTAEQYEVIEFRVGKQVLFETVPASVTDAVAAAEVAGATAVLAGRGPVAEGVIVLTDEIEPSAASAVKALHDNGVGTHLLTGDNERTAQAVGSSIGIAEVTAEVLPQDKVAAIERFVAGGSRVAMVGDGINDAAALATADVGIAAASGTDIARSAADVTLLSRDLRLVPTTLALSRRVLGTIRGNLFWAFAYNVAAIPLAAAGVLDPMVAAGAMAASSLFVVGNSLRLRRFDGGTHGDAAS